jgi:hypothetical protein
VPRRTEGVGPKSSREEMDGELGEGWLVAMWAWIDAGESIVSSLPYFLLFLSFFFFRSVPRFILLFSFSSFSFIPSIHPSFSGVKPHRYVYIAARVDQTRTLKFDWSSLYCAHRPLARSFQFSSYRSFVGLLGSSIPLHITKSTSPLPATPTYPTFQISTQPHPFIIHHSFHLNFFNLPR